MDRRPKAGLKRPAIAGEGFKVLSVEHLFLPFEFRHDVDSISANRVENNYFEETRIVGNLSRRRGLFNKSAALRPAGIRLGSTQPFPTVSGLEEKVMLIVCRIVRSPIFSNWRRGSPWATLRYSKWKS